ncbi:MAG: sugar kinase [Candidatus Omnitrophica bacterium]|nr:sugar kinase [Candidatus Omnitrophota bacterium]
MSIVVLGTVAFDSVKTPSGVKENLLGGSAAHFSASASFFTEVNLAAVVGEDFPQKHIDFFKSKKIILSALTREKGCTFRWQGEYKKNDMNSACTLHTELGVITKCLPRLENAQKNIKNVFLANYDPDLQMGFLKTMKNPQFVGMDTMNLWIHNKRKPLAGVLKKADLLFTNDTEARDLSGENNIISAAKCLCSSGPKMVIIKKGEHGAFFYSKNFSFILPAFPVENVIDPTGAGDTFAGGVMGFISKCSKITQENMKKALAYGTIISSFNVEGFGLEVTGALKFKDVEKRLKIYKNFFIF